MPLRLASCVLLLALAVPAVALATAEDGPGRPHRWWQADSVKRQLELTDRQSAEVEAVFQAHLPKLRAAKQQLDELEAELSALIGNSHSDEAAVGRQIDRVEAVRSELSKTRTLMLFRMHRVLSDEQRARLKALHAEWQKGRRDSQRQRHQ